MIAILSIALASTSFAAGFVKSPPTNAAEIFIPVGGTGKQISLLELANISIKDYEQLSGRTVKGLNRLGFKSAQRKLRKNIRPDGTMTKRLAAMLAGEKGFNVEGFALGFLLNWLGVLIAYVAFKDGAKKNRIKWSWIGFGIGTVVVFILILAVFNSLFRWDFNYNS